MKENKELDPSFMKQLSQLKAVPERDRNAALRGRARFLAEASSLRPNRVQRKAPLFSKRFAWQFALASLVVLVMLFSGSAGAALAAQDDLPGQPLYPVKLLTEDVWLGLTSGTEARIDLLLGFMDVRINEMNQLALQGSIIPVETAERLESQVQLTLQLAAGLEDDEELQAALMHIQTRLEEQTRNLANVAGNTSELLQQVQLMLQARIRQVDEGLVDQQTFRNQMRSSQDDSSGDQHPGSFDFGSGSGSDSGSGDPDQTPGNDHTPHKTPNPRGTPTPGGGGHGNGLGPFDLVP